jgi:galactokinase
MTSSAESMKTRILDGFKKIYGTEPTVVSRAPGRLEILGNHTDYNEGVVLSVAVDRATWFAAAPAGNENVCRVHDLRDESTAEFNINDLDNPREGDWANYIKGVVLELQKRDVKIPAFDAVILSNVPLSAGMSSSAALEIATAYALANLADADMEWIEFAKIGQACENEYVGARTGLMDQFSSIRGRADQLVFSDFRSLTVENVPLPKGTALVVANSMVKHVLTGAYNERRERCENAVATIQKKHPQVKALRDVSAELLEEQRPTLDITDYRRALHVVGENARVFEAVECLETDDLLRFGQLMFDSHESSRVNFENSCEELDFLVEIGHSLPGCIGARLSGGGFGGITVHLVHEEDAEDYARRLATAYEKLTKTTPQVLICHAADGAGLRAKK